MEIVQSKLLSRFPELAHGFSTREWGNMSFRLDFSDRTRDNNLRFARRLGLEKGARFYDPNLAHGNTVVWLRKRPTAFDERLWAGHPHVVNVARGRIVIPENDCYGPPGTGLDACWTDTPGAYLSMRPADCAIVFLYDPRTRSLGLVHAGTAGILCGNVPFAIEMARRWKGIYPGDLCCFVAPSICARAYKLTETSAWENHLRDVMPEAAARAYDPKARLYSQLLQCGVHADQIEIHPDCTASLPDKYFSHHRSGDKERMLAVIGLRD